MLKIFSINIQKTFETKMDFLELSLHEINADSGKNLCHVK